MLPDIHRATQKFYIFLIVYLTGCTPILFTESVSFACANQKSSCLYSGVLLSFKVQIQERYGEHYDKIRMPRWHER